MTVPGATVDNLWRRHAVRLPRADSAMGPKEHLALVHFSDCFARHNDRSSVLRRCETKVTRKLHSFVPFHGRDELHDGRDVGEL